MNTKYFITDFEKIDINLIKEKQTIQDIIYVRFIKKSVYDTYFKSSQVDKIFFLPTKQEKKIFRNIREIREGTIPTKIPTYFKNFFPKDIIEILDENSTEELWYIEESKKVISHPQDLGDCSTSMYVLYKNQDFDKPKSLLTMNDLNSMEDTDCKKLLLSTGLKISSLIPLEKMYTSIGVIENTEHCIVSKNTTHLNGFSSNVATEDLIQDSSHVGLYKKEFSESNLDFSHISEKFTLLPLDFFKSPTKKKNKRREPSLNK